MAALQTYGIPVASVRLDPVAAARGALRQLDERADRIVIHVDVDVVDFLDTPLSENDGRNVGLTLEQALESLAALCSAPNLAGVTVTELNPDHGDPDGADLARLRRRSRRGARPSVAGARSVRGVGRPPSTRLPRHATTSGTNVASR